jgi:GWxTD domain-containing protein
MKTLHDWRGARLAVSSSLLVVGLLLAGVAPAPAAWLRPVAGNGHFHFVCDVATLSNRHGGHDVVAMFAVPHREITFADEAGRWRGRLRVTATLVGLAGQQQQMATTLRVVARNRSEADSPTLQQIFSVVLEDVTIPAGRLSLLVEDLNRRRPGLVNLGTDNMASSLAVADWFAPPRRQPRGLSVGDAIFMAQAPIQTWQHDGRPVVPGADGPWEYLNPARRFGLECEVLQLYFTLEPPVLAEDRQRAAQRDVFLEIQSDRLDFSLVDTLRLEDGVRRALAAGRPAAVYWEMDAGGLPPGAFRLGIAPLDSVGRGLLTGFDMVWSLPSLARATDDLLAEGRTVFFGADLDRFEEAPRVEQQNMLDAFWHALDPSPQDGYNETYAEFRRRVSYVQHYLGGWDASGAIDPRGRVYLLLGDPDSVREEAMPMNERELEDARIMLYERYAPEREGTMSKGVNINDGAGYSPYRQVGGVPMPYSSTAELDVQRHYTAANSRVFQLWRYDDGGDQLFPNSYSGQGDGLRFLFVDQTGTGRFVLEGQNARMMGD